MPSAQPIKPSQIQKYFEEASLDAAEILLDLVTAKVRARKQKSADAKAAQTKSKKAKGPAAAGAPAPGAETEPVGAGEAAGQ